MEKIENKKCSSSEHEDTDAIKYCCKCKLYMCNKCDIFHSKLFKNHQPIILEKDSIEIFTGFCTEESHNNELEYFCKTHNQLCCAACIAKIKKKENGKHKDCEVCIIEDIKEEKLNKLKENIDILSNLSKTLDEKIENLKKIFEQINKNKDEIKKEIQIVFTKIRNEINNREDQLLSQVDKKFEDLFLKEDTKKEMEKLPDKVKIALEKSTFNNKEFNEKNLNSLINGCIRIENDIEFINNIEEKIKKYNYIKNSYIIFIPKEEGISQFLEKIKNYGEIFDDFCINSSAIINDVNDLCLIAKWIKDTINKDLIQFEPIFKMSVNGTNSEDFHNICDNKGPTLTLIKTTKNKVFGGFTPLNWNNDKGNIYDELNQSFIFSLNSKKKYDKKEKEKFAIQSQSKYGPIFGNYDFCLKENMKTGEAYATEKSFYLPINNLEILGENQSRDSFEAEELEIYKVIY